MKPPIQSLKTSSVFQKSETLGGLNQDNRELLSNVAVKMVVGAGEVLFMQYDPGDAMYFILSGSVEISVVSLSGKKLSLNVMKSGDVFGEIATLDGGERTASATAVEKTQVLRISRQSIVRLIAEHPNLASDLIGMLCNRLRWISKQVEDLALLSVNNRIASRLLVLHQKFSDTEGNLRMSQHELADFFATSRETINKTLNLWGNDGIIELSRGKIRITNAKRLLEIAQSDPVES